MKGSYVTPRERGLPLLPSLVGTSGVGAAAEVFGGASFDVGGAGGASWVVDGGTYGDAITLEEVTGSGVVCFITTDVGSATGVTIVDKGKSDEDGGAGGADVETISDVEVDTATEVTAAELVENVVLAIVVVK